MLERNQWLAIGLISGFAYMLGKDRESFGAESFEAEWEDELREKYPQEFIDEYFNYETNPTADTQDEETIELAYATWVYAQNELEAESFEAEDSRRQLKKLMEGKSDAEKKRISKMVQVRGLENTIAELMTNAEVFAATTFDEDDDSPKINQEDWMPRTDCEICARPFTINRFGQQLIQHYLKESDNGEKAWKSKKNTDGTRRTARNLAGFFLYEYGLDALNQYVLFQDKTGISDKVIELLRLSLVERVIAGDVVNLIEMMDMSDEVDDEPMFGKKFEEDFGSEGN